MTEQSKSMYAVIPATLLYDKNVSARQKLLMAVITNLANEKGYCWAGNEFLADQFDVSIDTIKRDIKSLIEAEYLTRKLVYKEGTKVVEKRILTPSAKLHPPQFKSATTPPCKSAPYNNTSNELTNNNYKKVNQKDFDEARWNMFWDNYPNKVGKKKAKSKFAKLSLADQQQAVLKVQTYRRYRPFPEYSYMNPTTYLNQERWNDLIPNSHIIYSADTLLRMFLAEPRLIAKAEEILEVELGKDNGTIIHCIVSMIMNRKLTLSELEKEMKSYLYQRKIEMKTALTAY